MSRRVQAVPGVVGLALPRGWMLNAGDIVVIPDEEWVEIGSDAVTLGHLTDLGYTADLPDPVPTWRDIQRAVSGGSTGLEAQITTLETAHNAHVADTTDVHGIPDTSLLETKTGAQDKVDLHAADTTSVHGITDTSKLAWNQNVDVSTAVEGDVLTKVGGVWVGSTVDDTPDYYQEITFATPSSVWAHDHNQNHYGLSVETFDANGNPMLGHVKYPTANRIEIEWFYPMTGRAVIHE